MIRTLALVALTQAFQAPSRRCQLRARRQATDGDELARLREEIKELEDSLEKDKQEQRKAAPVVVESKPEPKKERITGGAAIRDGKVQVDTVLSKLDTAQLPATCDAEAEKRKFAEVLNLEKMQGEGLKHVDVMQARVVTLDADLPVKHALDALASHGATCLPVWDSYQQRFVDVFTCTDLVDIVLFTHRALAASAARP